MYIIIFKRVDEENLAVTWPKALVYFKKDSITALWRRVGWDCSVRKQRIRKLRRKESIASESLRLCSTDRDSFLIDFRSLALLAKSSPFELSSYLSSSSKHFINPLPFLQFLNHNGVFYIRLNTISYIAC